jgi:ribosomal protein S27E
MPESVPVRCPACRREHVYTAPAYHCACGTPAALRLDPTAGPAVVEHPTWDEEWVTVRCTACGRTSPWPHPELGCPCGKLLRLAVSGTPAPPARAESPAPKARAPRAPFRPVTIRTARDAVTAAALYLRWLGYGDIRRADQRPPSGIGIAAHGLVAHVDPTVRPASVRDVECLWLTAMTESACCVYFSLAGYAEDARARADTLGVPLFVLDLTGTPQPVNGPGRALAESGSA